MGKEINVPAFVLDQLREHIKEVAEASVVQNNDPILMGQLIGIRYVLKLLQVEV